MTSIGIKKVTLHVFYRYFTHADIALSEVPLEWVKTLISYSQWPQMLFKQGYSTSHVVVYHELTDSAATLWQRCKEAGKTKSTWAINLGAHQLLPTHTYMILPSMVIKKKRLPFCLPMRSQA